MAGLNHLRSPTKDAERLLKHTLTQNASMCTRWEVRNVALNMQMGTSGLAQAEKEEEEGDKEEKEPQGTFTNNPVEQQSNTHV